MAHRGGVTLGPYVGDTFALIEAPGASGARVMDGQGARVDRFGYALAPSLVPYHYNTVALNPEGMNDKAELEDGQRRVAPYAGATVRLHFNTVRGQALLITAQRPDNAPILMGANVLDAAGNCVGMVGQANQVYLRSDKRAGELTLNWGDAPASSARCITACLPGKTARFNGSAPRAASPLNLFSGETMKRIFTRSPPWRCSPCRCSARPPRWRNAPGSPLDRFRLRSLRVGTALGRVNLTSTYLQPVGTPLGTSVFDLTSGTRYPDPNKVLYECDAGDAGQIYEVFATNGDDRVGGYYDLGAQDGNPNYYATYFPTSASA